MEAGDRPGKMIAGRYELLEQAGEGGMAFVWRGVVRGAGNFARTVAVKRILAGKDADPSFVRLFEEEARVGADLHHPNIVQITDFGVDDEGDYYLVMEWIEGLDLYHWVRSHPAGVRPTPWPLVAAIGVEVLRGLGAAHDRLGENGQPAPVFHRDISPGNVLLGNNGSVKLSDFGLARAMDRASMTRPNVIKGKLAYTAPELIQGSAPTVQSDLFAVCVCLWEALAQKRLFTGKNDIEVLLAVRRCEVEPLTDLRVDLPQNLMRAILWGLAREPGDRPNSAVELSRAFAAVLKTFPDTVDAVHLGQSVRAGRERLGLPVRGPKASEARPVVASTVPEMPQFPVPGAAKAPPPRDEMPTVNLRRPHSPAAFEEPGTDKTATAGVWTDDDTE